MTTNSDRRSSDEIGMRIRDLRSARRMTLAELSERSGLTRGFLSKLERGQSAVSVTSLMKIADAFALPLSDLVGPGAGYAVTRRTSEDTQLDRETLLSPADERRMEARRIWIPAGEARPFDALRHGQLEFVYVLSGEVRLISPGGTAQLREGDAITISSTTSLRAECPDGSAGVMILCVMAPAGRTVRS